MQQALSYSSRGSLSTGHHQRRHLIGSTAQTAHSLHQVLKMSHKRPLEAMEQGRHFSNPADISSDIKAQNAINWLWILMGIWEPFKMLPGGPTGFSNPDTSQSPVFAVGHWTRTSSAVLQICSQAAHLLQTHFRPHQLSLQLIMEQGTRPSSLSAVLLQRRQIKSRVSSFTAASSSSTIPQYKGYLHLERTCWKCQRTQHENFTGLLHQGDSANP